MDEHALRKLTAEDLAKLEGEGFDRDEPNGPLVIGFTAAIVVTVVIVVLAVDYLYQATYEQNVYQSVLAPESQELKEIRTREAEQLNHYRFADAEKKTVRLPIDRAMELFAAEAGSGKLFYPAKSAPVKTAEQLAAAAGATADGGKTPPAGAPAAGAGVAQH
jgi:stringent starvation protein B